LLARGFLCRGGITQGWHYYDDKIIFSQALVEAYILESKKANHPLILIHPKLMEELRKRDIEQQKYYEYMCVHDTAGKSFLHPFNYSIVDELFFGFKNEVDGRLISERKQMVKMFMNIINKRIDELIGSSAVDKWQWMKEFSYYTLSNKYADRFRPGLFPKVL